MSQPPPGIILQNNPAPEIGPGQERDWFFTFGFGQAHPNCYVKIYGTIESSREEMFRRYGKAWCMQYPDAEKAGVERWNLKEVQ